MRRNWLLFVLILIVATSVALATAGGALAAEEGPQAGSAQEQGSSEEPEDATPEAQSQGGEEGEEAEEGEEGEEDAEASQQGDDRDCADFDSQEEAQQFFEEQGGPDEDPHRLDEDQDGEACEEHFSGTPQGGVDTGLAPTDPSARGALDAGTGGSLLLAALGALAALALGAGWLGLRRRASA